MSTAAIVVGIVSAVISVVTSMTASGAQMAAAKEEKKIGGEQAKSVEKQAELARQANEIKQKQHRESIRRILASQRAQVGASGLMSMGSPLAAYEYTMKQGEQDLALIKKQGELEIQTLKDQARIIRRQTAKGYKFAQWGAVLTGLGGSGQALGGLGGLSGRATTTTQPKPAVTSGSTSYGAGGWTTGSGFSYAGTRYGNSGF